MATTTAASFVSAVSSNTFLAAEENADSLGWLPNILYGRTKEELQLKKVYQLVLNTHMSQIVMVHGESGSGKTSVVDLLRTVAVQTEGYFVSGKFFQGAGTKEPYAPIMAAFSDLCDLVSQSDDFHTRIPIIQKNLGGAATLLANNISHLSPFIDPDVQFVDGHSSFQPANSLVQFANACKTFLRAMSSKEHPIVFVLDDLQWMDKESQHLLSFMLKPSEIDNVVFVMMYRDEDNREFIQDLVKSIDAPFVKIGLQNLKTEATHQLVSSMLSLSPGLDTTRDLCDLVAKRTHGNPFHILSFVYMLERDGHLRTEIEGGDWHFNVDEIKRETQNLLTNTIAQLLQRRIDLLPQRVQRTLSIACFLGFRFSKRVVADVVDALDNKFSYSEESSYNTQINVCSSLDIAEKEGFIEATSEGFQFCHDKFQSALQSRSDPDEIVAIKWEIGETLLTYEGEEYNYHAALHLHDRSFELIRGPTERLKLARVNLEASKYCLKKLYLFESVELLTRGHALLPGEEATQWKHHYQLKLQMVDSLAKAALKTGDSDLANQMCLKVFEHARCVDDKLEAMFHRVRVCVLNTKRKFSDCIAAVDTNLKTLGFHIPSSVSVPTLLYKFHRVKRLLRGKTDKDILNLPIITDKAMNLTVKMLVFQAICCAFHNQMKRAVFCMLSNIEYCLKNGLSRYTAAALVPFAVLHMSLGKAEDAKRFSRLALSLSDQIQCREAETFITAALSANVAHWSEPYVSLHERLDTVMRNDLTSGDVLPGTAALLWIRFHSGENLTVLTQRHKALHTRLLELKQERSQLLLKPMYQCLLNLQSESMHSWRELTELSGTVIKEKDFLSGSSSDAIPDCLLGQLWAYKIKLAYHFGYSSEAVEAYKNLAAKVVHRQARFHCNQMVATFYTAMAYFQLFRENSLRADLRQAKRYKRCLEKLQTLLSGPNLAPLLALLRAESLSLKKSATLSDLNDAFATAIVANAEAGFVHMEALSNERAASACIRRGDDVHGAAYLERAIALYRDGWGATAKANWLGEQLRNLLLMTKIKSISILTSVGTPIPSHIG